MVAPALLAGMKERYDLAGQGLLGASGAAFELVAAAAGKTKVFKEGFAALRLGIM